MAKDQIDRAEGVAAGDVAAVSKKQEVAALLKKLKVEEEGGSPIGEAVQSESAFDAASSEQEVAAAQGAFAADGAYEVAQAGSAGASAGSAASAAPAAAAGGMSTGTMLALGGVALVAGGVAIASSGGGGGGGGGSGPKPYGEKFGLTVSPTSVSEGAVGTKEMTFSLVLDEAPKQAITISYQTLTSGSATTGSDFVGESGTVTFAAGQAAASITITVNGDVTVEGDETVQVLFSSRNLDGNVAGTGTITNDDVAVPGGVSEIFTLKEVVIEGVPGTQPETRIYWGYTPGDDNEEGTQGGVPVEDMLSFLTTITGLDLAELGLIDDDGVGPFDNVTTLNISNALSLGLEDNDLGDDGEGAVLTINYNDGTSQQFNIEAQISEQYFKFLNDLLFTPEGESRLYEVEVPGTGTETTYDQIVPIRLTPQENNGATLELGSPLTTGANSLIIAGRVELLHQAYIDAGAGNNILEVDAKGTYAQPAAILNVQEIRVNDLPNFYTTGYGQGDGNLENTEFTSGNFPSPTGQGSDNTWLDLNRALQLTKLVVTDQGTADSESDNGSGSGEGSFDGYSGDLTIVGVRNAATLRLEGGFNSGTTTIQYGQGQTGTLNVELVVGTVEADINILQNASVLRIDSQGVENNLNQFFMGGDISRLIVTGEASFSVQGNIGPSFNSNRPAVIDASDNTAGVDLNVLSGVREVRFLSSQGEDDVNFLLPDSSLGITKITVTGQDGDGHYDLDANVVNVVLGNGDNVVHAGELFGDSPDDRSMDIANITVGNGKNTIDAIAFVGGTLAPNPSPEANVNEETQSKIVITAGSGGNDINAWGDFVTVNTGTGNDEINVTGRDIRINSNGGDDVVTIFGNNDDFQGSSNTLLISQEAIDSITNGVLLNINLGTGNNTLVLGGDVDSILQPIGSVTALSGSVITGSNITLVVNETSDLRAASLTGITRVVLDDDSANGDGEGANNAQLTLTAAQFTAIGPAAFDVEFAAFGAAAQVKIIITQDTNLNALGDLSLLSPNVRLNFEIYNDATLTLTAEQLHTYVATDGITVGEGFNGNVVINNAGPNFDPFQDTVGGLNVGSLSDSLGSSDDVTINRTPGGFERDLPDPNQDQLIITNAGPDVLMVGPIDLTGDQNAITEVILNGGGAFNFANAGPVLLPENFVLDFSAAGAVSNLTIGNFENITFGENGGAPDSSERDLWGEIIGNGLPGQRINVQLSADVGDAADAVNGGFKSSGVEVYVATELTDPNEGGESDLATGAQWTIATCVNTQDITTLGLQGNYEDTLTYANTERGIDFLMEVVYVKDQGYVVGSLVTDFARPGGTAVVNVVGLSALPEGEVQKVAGIDVTDAISTTINVTGGNTVIEDFDTDGNDDLVDLTVTADADLDFTPGEFLTSELASFDASGVVGELSIAIDLPSGEGANGPLVFIGAAGGTELNIDDAAVGAIASIDGAGAVNLTIGNELTPDTVDLTETLLGNIGTVSLNDDTTLSITLEQADAIGPANFLFLGDVDAGDTATLNLVGLNDQAFSVADYPEGFIITLTLAEIPEVFINPLTDFTGIDSLIIPEGTTLYLSMEQFQQLGVDGMGDDTVLTGLGSVVITGTTQASVGESGEDLDLTTINLTGAESTVTVNLAESVDLSQATMALANLTVDGAPAPLVGTTGPSVDVFNIGTFTLTLGDINTADTTDVIGGAGSTLKFTDIDEVDTSRIDASGFDVDVLEVEAALVADKDVDFLFDNLIERVTKVIVDEFGQVVGRIQNVVIEATTTVPGSLEFNDYGLDSEVTTLNLTLGGGALLDGDLIVSTKTPTSGLIATYLEELNIISEGTEANTLNGATDNVITGNVTPLTPTPGYDPDGVGEEFGAAADNNLKVVNITATQNLVIGDGDPESDGIGGSIIFSSHGSDGVGENEPVDNVTANDDNDATVTLNISGSANVTVEQLDMSDEDIGALVINNAGTGTLTVTGASPAIVTGAGSESVIITGSGAVVLSDADPISPNTTLDSDTLSVFDASAFTGNLSAGEIANVDNADFSFTAGSGITTMTFTDGDLDSTGDDPVDTDDDTAGWVFDFSNAAAGSEFHFAPSESFVAGSKLTINMGPNAVLFIDETMDLSDLDLTILGGQAIVLADGAELTLTAEQASGLTIIAGPDGDGNLDTNGVVNIVNLNENPVDLSGISEDVAGVATLQLDDPMVPLIADVTLDAATDLGFFAVQLTAISDADEILSGQTIRFTTVEQAEREVLVVGAGGVNADDVDTVNSTNVVWLFENLNGGQPIDTSGYFEPGAVADGGYQIGRLWLNNLLIENEGGDIEGLFTTLPTSIIRAEFADAELLDALLNAEPVNRIFEVVSFLDLRDISFSDAGIEPDEFIESLTIKMGGQSDIDNIVLDDEIAPNTDPDSVAFTTLNIESHRALSDDYFLATEFYVNNNDGIITAGEDVLPDALNTIGDISTGNGLELENVSINTLNDSDPLEGTGSVVGDGPGAALETGTITFDSNDAGTVVNLSVTGENDVTIASVNTTDADIVGIVTVNNLSGGATLIAPGASPAFNLDNTEGWVLQDGEGDAAMVLGSATNAGVVGNELSLIDASATGGDLDFGVIADIDGSADEAEDFDGDGNETDPYESENEAFEFTAGLGVTTMTLGTANGRTPTLEAGNTWTFTYSGSAAGSSLTITDDVIFQPSPPLPADPTLLVLNDVPLIIEGTVDFTQITLDFNGSTAVSVPAGNSLVLTIDQVAQLLTDGIEITGSGTVVVEGEVDTDAAVALDLSGIQTVNIDLSGITNAGASPQVNPVGITLAVAGAIPDGYADPGDEVGFNVVGTDFDDAITGSNEDDTFTMGAGDDSLTGGLGSDTFNVDDDVDSITDLLGQDPSLVDPADQDVLVVSAGAEALADTTGFIATAETVNNGTATITAVGGGNVTIDVSAAGGANGWNLTGSTSDTLTEDTLTGSAQDDRINGGNDTQTAAAAIDLLTGNGGSDIFEFNQTLNAAATLTAASVTPAVDREEIVIVADGADDLTETLTVSYTLNGDPNSVLIALGTINAMDAAAVADAVADALDARAGISATSAGAVVTVTGDAGGNLNIVSVVAGGATTLSGADVETITLTADGADDGNEHLIVNFVIDGVADSVDVDLATPDTTDLAAVRTAVVAALDADPDLVAVNGSGAGDVRLTTADGGSILITSITTTGTVTGLGGTVSVGSDVDQAQVSTLTVTGTPQAGDIYSLLADFAGPTAGETTTSTGETTATAVAAELATFVTTEVTDVQGVAPNDNVITFTDTNADNGGFELVVDTTAAFAGSGASAADVSGPNGYLTADQILDFMTGEDSIDLNLGASVGAYGEGVVGGAGDYAAAYAAADAFFVGGTEQYFFTFTNDLDADDILNETNDEAGLLFFDANIDGSVDGVLLLMSATPDNSMFASTDIIV